MITSFDFDSLLPFGQNMFQKLKMASSFKVSVCTMKRVIDRMEGSQDT